MVLRTQNRGNKEWGRRNEGASAGCLSEWVPSMYFGHREVLLRTFLLFKDDSA
jgi:hypothetical protein